MFRFSYAEVCRQKHLPEKELRKKRSSSISLLQYMSQNIYTWQQYIIIIIIIITIIIISLFRNTQIIFAEFCKYGTKNSGIINNSYTIHGEPQSSYCFKETDHTSPFSVTSVTVRSFHSTPV